MHSYLYHYDVYPKAFLGDRETTVTIRPLGSHAAFAQGHEYTVHVRKVNHAAPYHYPEYTGRSTQKVTPDGDGCLRITAYFEGEGEHYIRICNAPDANPFEQFSVYSLAEDMTGRYPYRGDLHLHTCRSDGSQAPEVVCANYRGNGYDFTVISDHFRYYPSLEAKAYWKDLTDLTIVQGEEIHLPHNDVHYVNFGGKFSVNALLTPNTNQEKNGDDPAWRTSEGADAPAPMTHEQFSAMIEERAAKVDREKHSERMSFAVLEWIYEQVQKAEGLGIFPHPYWISDMMQLPEDYTYYVYEKAPFDAFEVLGGENYFSHNGFQTALYYEMKQKGIDHPVVGSTDSHNSIAEQNRNALICSTIVFARENERPSLIDAIKQKYSVAVDTISTEYRIVGDFRLQKYACFLMEHYYPLHDAACAAEGYYMNKYIAGDPRAAAVLRAMKGQIPEMIHKYFTL
ncbi:MAG: hypothetical protein IJW70_02420 [Clostridia bacterium]|nr:hypothetical protein [Clostridia bacterium]